MFPELTVAVTLSPLPERLKARGGHGEGICHSLSAKLNTEENLESRLVCTERSENWLKNTCCLLDQRSAGSDVMGLWPQIHVLCAPCAAAEEHVHPS